MSYDLLFGGGSYEHEQMKNGVRVLFAKEEFTTTSPNHVFINNYTVANEDFELSGGCNEELADWHLQADDEIYGSFANMKIDKVKDTSARFELNGKHFFVTVTPEESNDSLKWIIRFEIDVSISEPAGFSEEQLYEWFGANDLGGGPLYDPEQHWLAAAVSSFGIVYNTDALETIGVETPRTWDDLTDPAYRGWLAMADPRASGSVATAFQKLLDGYGWERGWNTLRRCRRTRGISARRHAGRRLM